MNKPYLTNLPNQTLYFTCGLLIIFIFYTQLNAQSHIPVFPGLTGDDLLTEVVNEYKPSTVLDYGEARDLMYGTIYNVNDR